MSGCSSIQIQKTNRSLPLLGVLALALLALRGYGQAAQQPSHNIHVTPPAKSAPAFQEAEELIQKGLFEQAREKIEEQLKLSPASVEGYNLLGIVYTSEKDYNHALDAFQRALELEPNSAKTHNNLGNLYAVSYTHLTLPTNREV